MQFLDFLFRWAHVLFGITWIGMLYYFNFVQGGYFKEANADALADAKAKLAPKALWWFRWGALFTFITGIYLLHYLGKINGLHNYIALGAIMGAIMFLNVWLIIWPNQQIALGMKEGDSAKAAAKALLASRTNALLSAPMLFGMLVGAHWPGHGYGSDVGGTGLLLATLLTIALAVNGIAGKQGPLTTVKGVIHCSLGLTALMVVLLTFI